MGHAETYLGCQAFAVLLGIYPLPAQANNYNNCNNAQCDQTMLL